MKHLIYLLSVVSFCVACKKDYKCTTTIQRVEDDYELQVTEEEYKSISKDEMQDIEGVEFKTYKGMDAKYITVCEED